MIKRTIEVSGPQTALSLRDKQVIVRRDGEQIARIPAEDVGILIIDSPTTTYTHGTVVELVAHGAVVVLAGPDHLPAALLTPCVGNSIQTERIAHQVNASQPTRKRLWMQVVVAKIRNQAANISHASIAGELLQLARNVRSGDPDNMEAQAARLYWGAWLPDFRRQTEGDPPNNLLNYGYAILRAATARAIVGAGLHPSIALHHHNRYDPFCLADDLMEPLRPLVDRAVREIHATGQSELSRDIRARILGTLLEPVGLRNRQGPLFVEVERVAASLALCLSGESQTLELPELE